MNAPRPALTSGHRASTPWRQWLAAVAATSALMAISEPVRAQSEAISGSPAKVLAAPIQASLTFAGDEIATSGSFWHRSDVLDAKIDLQRLQYHRDLPNPTTGLLAGWTLRGVASYSDYYARSQYSPLAYSMRETVSVRTVSLGVKGTRGWGEHLYGLTGLSLHIARFEETVNFGSLPDADQVYAALNNSYINTTIWTASITARIGAGWRQPLDARRRLHGVVEASWLPLYTRTIRVENDGQQFSKQSSSLHLRAGLEWQPAMTVLDRPVAIAPFVSRRQFFNKVQPLGEASLNEVSLELLLSPSRQHQSLAGFGIGLSWMKGGDWSGWRIQFRGLFG